MFETIQSEGQTGIKLRKDRQTEREIKRSTCAEIKSRERKSEME